MSAIRNATMRMRLALQIADGRQSREDSGRGAPRSAAPRLRQWQRRSMVHRRHCLGATSCRATLPSPLQDELSLGTGRLRALNPPPFPTSAPCHAGDSRAPVAADQPQGAHARRKAGRREAQGGQVQQGVRLREPRLPQEGA